MVIKYGQLLSDIDVELLQTKESGDTADAEKYRILPHSELARYANETLLTLSKENPSMYEDEFVITLFDSGDGDYYPPVENGLIYLDIAESVIDNDLILPSRIEKIQAIMTPLGKTTRTGQWIQPYNSSVSSTEIYCPSPNKIYNSNGWVAGDTLRVRASVRPVKLKPAMANSSGTAAIGVVGVPYTTITLASNNGLERGDYITISSAFVTAYNGTHRILHANGNIIKIDFDNSALPGSALTVAFDHEDQDIDIEEAHYRYFYLIIKRRSLLRKKVTPSREEDFEINTQLRPLWQNEVGRLNVISLMRFTGNGFGGGR
ncbi:MAG TPA: hypothetical protein PLB16_05750 [bacterium]|nr:hypothetical protein [bacterium]